MCVLGVRKAENVLKRELAGRARKQIGAPYDFRDPLRGIVYNDSELIGEQSIATTHDEVATLRCEINCNWTLGLILEADGLFRSAKANRERSIRRADTAAAPAGVVQFFACYRCARLGSLDFGSATGTEVDRISSTKLGEGRLVSFRTEALVDDWAIPFEAERFQRTENGARASRNDARSVEVFYANGPGALCGTCIDIARNCSDERSEVQGAGGGGSETAAIGLRGELGSARRGLPRRDAGHRRACPLRRESAQKSQSEGAVDSLMLPIPRARFKAR